MNTVGNPNIAKELHQNPLCYFKEIHFFFRNFLIKKRIHTSLVEFPGCKIPLFLQPISVSSLESSFCAWRSIKSANQQMGVVLKLVDAILFLLFLLIAVVAPLIDAQTCLPLSYFPDFLVQLKAQYTHDFGDYLIAEKPHFFVGLVWLELLFQWPLALLNLYAILTSKPWFKSTCLIYGVSVSTSMAAVLSEMMGSKRASDKLLTLYASFLGLGVLAMLRGLLTCSSKTTSAHGKRPALARKKRV
ncbi:Transmembrane protein 97 [Spatholobus suberectus]|nr:Transmembrane protein 97 [Spatholobus suberectus]